MVSGVLLKFNNVMGQLGWRRQERPAKALEVGDVRAGGRCKCEARRAGSDLRVNRAAISAVELQAGPFVLSAAA